MNDAMKDYLRRTTREAIEIMIRDGEAVHLFDVDSRGEYVFMMGVFKRDLIGQGLPMRHSIPLDAEPPEIPAYPVINAAILQLLLEALDSHELTADPEGGRETRAFREQIQAARLMLRARLADQSKEATHKEKSQ